MIFLIVLMDFATMVALTVRHQSYNVFKAKKPPTSDYSEAEGIYFMELFFHSGTVPGLIVDRDPRLDVVTVYTEMETFAVILHGLRLHENPSGDEFVV